MKLKIKNIKIIYLSIILLISSLYMFSCKKEEINDNVTFVKKFYMSYLSEVEKSNIDVKKINTIKESYLTNVMAEEMEFRSRHRDCDMFIMSQDPTGFSKILKVDKGDDDSCVNVNFDTKNEYGSEERLAKIHVIKIDGEKKIDAIDNYVKRYDKNGNLIDEYNDITKYGNKVITDEIKKEMQDERDYFKKMDEEGYIS